MSRQITPLELEFRATGTNRVQGQIRQTADSFSELGRDAATASRAIEGVGKSGRDIAMAARQSRQMDAELGRVADTSSGVSRRMQQVARETGDAEKHTHGLALRARDAGNRFRELAGHAQTTVKHVAKVWDIVSALKKGGPLKIFDAVVPDEIKRKIGKGMIAGGVTMAALLGATIGPAKSREAQTTAISELAGSKEAGKEIYHQADEYSVASVFNLPELVDAAKTLTKDRQFSNRLLKAADNLASTDPEQFKPQDSARAFGRIRSGQTGEGLERIFEMGLNRLDLEAKGIKFDGQGAVADKTPQGITRLINAIVESIEERFGSLSEKLATTTLVGSLSAVGDASGRLAASLGETFIPTLTLGANSIAALTTWINGLSDTSKKTIAWVALAGAGLLIFGGTMLIVGGTIAKVLFLYKTLNFVLGLFGTSIWKLSVQYIVPSIMRIAAAGALLAIIAAMSYVAIKGSQDAMKMSNAELEYQWGAIGKFWVKAAALLDRVLNHPIFKAMFAPQYALAKRLGLVDGDKDKGDADAEKSRQIINKSRKRRGLKPIGKEDFENSQIAKEETIEQVRARRAKAGTQGNALTQLQADWAKKFGGALAPGAMTGTGAVALSGGYGFPSMPSGNIGVDAAQTKVDSIEAEIAELQDKKRNASKEEKKVIAEQIAQAQRRLKGAKRELAAAKRAARQSEKTAKDAERGAMRAEKYDEVGKYDAQIESLQSQLERASEVGDAARVESLAVEIEQLKALDKYDRAMLLAKQTANVGQRRAMEAAAKRALSADKIAAARAGNKAVDPLNRMRAKDARMLAQMDGDAATQDKIFALESELEKAKEEKNATQVRALTLQIGQLKAQSQYEQDLIGARDEINVNHRNALEQKARKDLEIANRRAVRDADLAMMRTANSAKTKGKKGKGENLSDDAVRAQMAMMRGGNASFVGGPALGSGINYGDRFAEADRLRTRYEASPLRTRYEASPLRSFQAYNTTDAPQMDIDALKVPEVVGAKRGGKVKVKSRHQNSNGDWIFKIEDIIVPYMGLSSASD